MKDGFLGNAIQNKLLQLLPSSTMQKLSPYMVYVDLPLKHTLARPDTAAEFVYFLEAGVVSMISILENGTQIEVGLVGSEGFIGLSVLFGAPTSSLEALVQVSGQALRLPAEKFREVLRDAPELYNLLLRYVDSFVLQISQAVSCNGRHLVEQRLARWILMTHDRVGGSRFTMTHDFMACMLGVRRSGVTTAIGVLQQAGLIQAGRGSMQVIDRAGLETASCECYRNVQRRFEWLS
jgi:CRP-like cAMP-binding protein